MRTDNGTVAATPTPPARVAGAPPFASPLLTEQQAAAYLGVSTRHLRDRGDIPRVDIAARGSRAMWRYLVRDLERWVEGRTMEHQSGRAS